MIEKPTVSPSSSVESLPGSSQIFTVIDKPTVSSLVESSPGASQVAVKPAAVNKKTKTKILQVKPRPMTKKLLNLTCKVKTNRTNDVIEACFISNDEVLKKKISYLPVSKLQIFPDATQGNCSSVYDQELCSEIWY
jgi:hypothetical protein